MTNMQHRQHDVWCMEKRMYQMIVHARKVFLKLQSLCLQNLQVLRYFDYVFTGVFTFEMIIKVGDRDFSYL